MRAFVLGALLVAMTACGGMKSERNTVTFVPAEASQKEPAKKHPPHIGKKREPKPVPRPNRLLTLAEAQKYVLALVNRDRESEGLLPLAWDETAAKAGMRHAQDMARHGFTAHWGTDGSVPEQRHTEAGGSAMVMENAACFFDGKLRELDPNPRFRPEALEKIQAAFFNEKPPNDGHRRAILTPWHTHLGVGLAQAVGSDVPCMAQELTSHYGTYEKLPKTAKRGQKVRVAGKVEEPAIVRGVGIARIDLPKPMTPERLNQTGGYPVPAPFATYFPEGFVTPIPLRVKGNRFEIEVPLDDGRRPGLYEVSVWGEVPETKDLVMLSLRTIRVE